MLLRNADALVSEKHRYSFNRDPTKEQFNGEGVTESVCMTLRYFCKFE